MNQLVDELNKLVVYSTPWEEDILANLAVASDDGARKLKEFGIEVIYNTELDSYINEAICDSYYRVPDTAVIKYKDHFFMCNFNRGSYVEDVSDWYEVNPVEKTIIVYE